MSERNTTSSADRSSRRRFLKVTGASAVLATSLAGCAGTEGGGSTATATATEAPSGGDGGSTATETSEGGGGQTSTGTASSGPDKVVFGQPAGISGKWDFLQPAVSQASELATQQINEAGGPLGAEFELLRRDTAVNPQQARQVVRQLVNNDGVPAINGLFSSEIVPLWDFIQELSVPIISPWPGSTFLDTRGGDRGTPEDVSDDEWLWRTVIGDTVHTAGAAQAMVDNDFTNIGVMNGTSAGERSWADSFIKSYENLGGTVAERVEVSEGQSSYQSSLNRLFQADFDAWALGVALTDATTVIRDWSNAGYGRQLLLEDGLMDADLIDAVGEEAEGAWIAAGSTQGPNYESFLTGFQEMGDADVHTWGVASYDATNVLALATHRAGEATPEAIERNIGPVTREGGTAVGTFAEGKEALDAGEEINYEGAVTPVDFTEFGNVWGNVSVSTVGPDGFSEEFVIEADTLKNSISNY
jgi:ABC-type branched-subunit amino acid transport system substrate-binding protein